MLIVNSFSSADAFQRSFSLMKALMKLDRMQEKLLEAAANLLHPKPTTGVNHTPHVQNHICGKNKKPAASRPRVSYFC